MAVFVLAVGIDDPEIVFSVLEVGLRRDAVARRRRVARQSQILLQNLLSRAPDFDVGPVAFKGLIAAAAASSSSAAPGPGPAVV